MKNKFKVLRIITFVVVIIAVFINCGPPRLKGTVSIEGTPGIGSTLTANIASLGGSGIITYQWLRNGSTAIGDANSYTLQLADRDSDITVTVIRSDNSGSVTSAPVTNRGHFGGTGPGGGIIFYHAPNGFTMSDTGETAYFLEVAPNDIGEFVWATVFTNIPTRSEIGTGRQNTQTITSSLNATQAPAAWACKNFDGGGLDDWFLPSRDELDELFYRQRGVVDISSDWFWSSSQGSHINIAYGSPSGGYKTDALRVRAVRAF
jgi:hypothetical protein